MGASVENDPAGGPPMMYEPGGIARSLITRLDSAAPYLLDAFALFMILGMVGVIVMIGCAIVLLATMPRAPKDYN